MDKDIFKRRFETENSARDYIEHVRWNGGVVCPHCKSFRKAYKLKIIKIDSSSRPGLYKCRRCRKQFTVTVNTILHGSHMPINKMLMIINVLSKKSHWINISALARKVNITYSAVYWFIKKIQDDDSVLKKRLLWNEANLEKNDFHMLFHDIIMEYKQQRITHALLCILMGIPAEKEKR